MSSLPIVFKNRFGGRRKIILFLSTGNTCRAPMAASYFRKLLRDKKIENVDVRAAGVITVAGLRASNEAIQIMQREGIDLSTHRSSQLTPEIAKKADLILGMTPMHVQEALRISKDVRGKAYLLKEYAKSDIKNTQINDPMGGTLEIFKKIFREIRLACERLVQHEYVTGVPSREKSDKGKKPTAATRPARPARAAKPVAKPAPKAAKPVAKPAVKAAAKKAKPASNATLNLKRRVKPSTKLAARKSSKAVRGQGKLR